MAVKYAPRGGGKVIGVRQTYAGMTSNGKKISMELRRSDFFKKLIAESSADGRTVRSGGDLLILDENVFNEFCVTRIFNVMFYETEKLILNRVGMDGFIKYRNDLTKYLNLDPERKTFYLCDHPEAAVFACKYLEKMHISSKKQVTGGHNDD